jgi:hypothetical protein
MSEGAELSIAGAGGIGSGTGSGAASIFIGAVLGAAFFLGFDFFLTIRFAFFFAPFFTFFLIAKQSHRPNVEPRTVIKLA